MNCELKTLGTAAMVAVLSAAVWAATPMTPGDETDPSAKAKKIVKKATTEYVTPAHLRYPYLATGYVKPTVTPEEDVKVGWYVTDWRHSLVRFKDDSARFDVFLRYSADCQSWKTLEKLDVKTGDGLFELGKLPEGEYTLAIRCEDRKSGLSSHTVWHEFRVISAEKQAIAAKETYRVTEKDLATYGIVRDPGYERFVPVEMEDFSLETMRQKKWNYKGIAAMCATNLNAYLVAHPHREGKVPGYAVYVAAHQGVPSVRAYERCKVVYDRGYDTNAVEQAAVRTAEGLQKLLDEKAAAGFRKVVMLPGVYRTSAFRTVSVPNALTWDLGGATLKLNAFIGCHCCMVKLSGVRDAHLVNGTLEGDYYTHDYARSPNHSEWPLGFEIDSDSRYCSVEKVTVKNVTGYGGSNGMGKAGPHGDWLTFANEKGPMRNSASLSRKNFYTAGGLDWKTGAFDANDAYRFTTANVNVEGWKPFKYLTVSKALGYQGIRTRNWNYTVCFYDADGKFVSGEVAHQYRVVLVPAAAKTARFSIEVNSLADAEKCDLTVALWKIPWSCTIRQCVFDRCRAVGYAASGMRNFLFDENEFMYSGETLATCAFDAEDGWDGMQDVFFIANNFHDNPNNELLTCAGHNFQMIGNRANIHLWSRTYSPLVRGNDCGTASFCCANRNRTGYGRYEGNRIHRALDLGGSSNDLHGDWFITCDGQSFTSADPKDPFFVQGGATGVFRDCTFAGVKASPGSAINCTFKDCSCTWARHNGGQWKNCTAENCTFARVNATNVYRSCTFKNVSMSPAIWGSQTFDNCTIEDLRLPPQYQAKDFAGTVKANCKLSGKNVFPKPMVIEVK